MRGQPGLFDIDERLKWLSDLGDQLLAFARVVDFEVFRPELLRALAMRKARRAAVRHSIRLRCSRSWSFRPPTISPTNARSS